jgi:CheY-like chemotaxis protein
MEASKGRMMGTEMPTALAVAVDDNPDDRQLASLLEGSGLSVHALAPSSTVEATVAEVAAALEPSAGPGVVLVDYRLDQEQAVAFKGGTIAAALREAMPDTPLILFTTEERLRQWVDQQVGIRTLFDWQLIKGTVLSSDEARDLARRSVASIATSFALVVETRDRLRAEADVWDVIRIAMEAEPHELQPFRSSTVLVPHKESASQIGRWILVEALHHPGPLINSADARVLVGLDLDSWVHPRVSEWRERSLYTGVFAGVRTDWYWRGRLSRQVDELFEGALAPEDAAQRAAALDRLLDERLGHDRCSWCGDSDVLRACSICDRAVDSAHALRPLGAPDWSLGRVTCFACILSGEAEHERFDESAEEIAAMIRTGEISQPER